MRHLTYFRDPSPAGEPSIEQAFRAVPDAVRHAAEEAARRLTTMGIRHAVIGGLAVGAYGAPRNTTDVDFLVGLEAFESSGAVLVHRSGVPVRVGAVNIDLLPAEAPMLQQALDHAQPIGEHLRLIGLAPLIQMKLRAFRTQDQEDVRRLVRAGADLHVIKEDLAAADASLLARLDHVLERD